MNVFISLKSFALEQFQLALHKMITVSTPVLLLLTSSQSCWHLNYKQGLNISQDQWDEKRADEG